MHLKSVTLHPENYPNREKYPFSLPIFQQDIGPRIACRFDEIVRDAFGRQ